MGDIVILHKIIRDKMRQNGMITEIDDNREHVISDILAHAW